jgi:hypothetical protein
VRGLTATGVAAVAMLALASCAGTEPVPAGEALAFDACAALTISLERTVTTTHRDGVVAGAELWNARAATRLSVATGAAPAGAAAIPLLFRPAFAASRGYYDGAAGLILVNDGLGDRSVLAVTVAHELGHAFGLAHVPPGVRPSVMNPDTIDVEPTPEDALALAAAWGPCSATDLPLPDTTR